MKKFPRAERSMGMPVGSSNLIDFQTSVVGTIPRQLVLRYVRMLASL